MSRSGDPSIEVAPETSLFDEPIVVRIEGLRPGVAVTIATRMRLPDGTYSSRLTYRADDRGIVDLREDVPLDGTADRARPMAPFWSMTRSDPATAVPRSTLVRSVEAVLTAVVDGEPVASRTIERRLTAPSAIREPLGSGQAGEPIGNGGAVSNEVIAELWLPDATGRHPGVVLLGGSEGGYPPRLPAGLLAARGYAVLAPAYFGLEGLPPTLEGIDLTAFDRAIDRFRAHPNVRPEPIGVLGYSRGAELGLELAAREPTITTAIAYSPSHVRFHGVPDGFRSPDPAWLDGGRPRPSVPLSVSPWFPLRLAGSLLRRSPFALAPLYRRAIESASEATIDDARIDAGSIDGPVLLVSGGDDRLWPAARFARELAADAERIEHRHFPQAGHAIGVPYRPAGDSTVGPRLMPGVPIALGGEPAANASASETAWHAALDTLVDGLR